MRNKQKAKFFCENCGYEVPENAKVCKNCGKFFISVRCPKCGATGSHDEFSKGCPECGYAVAGNNTGHYLPGKNKRKNDSGHAGSLSFFSGIFNKKSADKNKTSYDTSLPLWIYFFTISALIIVLFAIYSCIIKSPVY